MERSHSSHYCSRQRPPQCSEDTWLSPTDTATCAGQSVSLISTTALAPQYVQGMLGQEAFQYYFDIEEKPNFSVAILCRAY